MPIRVGRIGNRGFFSVCADRQSIPSLRRIVHALDLVPVRITSVQAPRTRAMYRLPVCGLIAHYNATELPAGPDHVPSLMHNILTKRLTFRGFIVSDFAAQFPQFLADVVPWLKQGRIKYREREDIADGLRNASRELIGLLGGRFLRRRLFGSSPD